MDVQMPEMDGVECTREILRCHPPERRPIIVALTANATVEDARACQEAGMNDFLTKPIKPLELRACLERWGRKAWGRTPILPGRSAGSESCPTSQQPGRSAGAESCPTSQQPGRSAGSESCPTSQPAVSSPTASPAAVSPDPCPLPPDSSLIDEAVLADLRDLAADDPGLLGSFIDGFRQAVPEHVALMRDALAAGDGEQLRKVAHRLKGTAANVGACGVAAGCLELEKLGRSAVLTNGIALVCELERRYHRTAALFAAEGVSPP
jgi:CheY-like chemotaxis protein